MGTEPNISLLLTELQRNCQSLDTAEIATMKLNLEAWNVERYRETVKLDFQFSFFLGDKILVNLLSYFFFFTQGLSSWNLLLQAYFQL